MWWRCSLAWRAWEQSRSSVPHSERVAFRGLAGSEGLVGSDVLAGSAALAADSVGCGARNAAGLASSAVSALGRVLNSLVRGAIPQINAAAGRYGTSSTTSVNTETRMRAVASRGDPWESNEGTRSQTCAAKRGIKQRKSQRLEVVTATTIYSLAPHRDLTT